ncbi:Intracellular ribonuclease LX [Morella rubra]|uniref:Intracellular ribonuclease LX n=1 Tax=Morella rubra TaxID=262757 RepID=A0A6A1V135_9ROSI|nr:Intracellular ribonuclease LX [Morella rubra]
MKSNYSFLVKLLIVQCLAISYASQGSYDFFYFVHQWLGSYCDTTQGYRYSTTDFGIHGLWPNYDDGSYPSNYFGLDIATVRIQPDGGFYSLTSIKNAIQGGLG